jgi:hypothetical protein
MGQRVSAMLWKRKIRTEIGMFRQVLPLRIGFDGSFVHQCLLSQLFTA